MLHSQAIRRGRQYELGAVEKYGRQTGKQATALDLFVKQDYAFIVASPVVNDSTLLEMKCPFAARKKADYHNISSLPIYIYIYIYNIL